jgi:hypothetical protein
MQQIEIDFTANEVHHKNIHENSIESYHSITDKSKRREIVLRVFKQKQAPLTDRQVQHILGIAEKNGVSPRITELKKAGALVEMGKMKDPFTGKTVRLLALSEIMN